MRFRVVYLLIPVLLGVIWYFAQPDPYREMGTKSLTFPVHPRGFVLKSIGASSSLPKHSYNAVPIELIISPPQVMKNAAVFHWQIKNISSPQKQIRFTDLQANLRLSEAGKPVFQKIISLVSPRELVFANHPIQGHLSIPLQKGHYTYELQPLGVMVYRHKRLSNELSGPLLPHGPKSGSLTI